MAVNIINEKKFDGRCMFCGVYFSYEYDDLHDSNENKPDKGKGLIYVICPKCGKWVTNIWHNGSVKK